MSRLNIDRFEKYIDERRITSGRWLDKDALGREIACYYAALAPDGSPRDNPGTCPADALQGWIAHLLPWLDDSARDDAERYGRARRLVPILRRAADPQYQEAMRRADYSCRAVAVREARPYATGDALAAVDRVLGLLDRAARGETVDKAEWEEAERAEEERAAWAATWAAWVAARVADAESTREAAAEAAAVAWAAGARPAEAAASARIADGMLAALERAVGLREAA